LNLLSGRPEDAMRSSAASRFAVISTQGLRAAEAVAG